MDKYTPRFLLYFLLACAVHAHAEVDNSDSAGTCASGVGEEGGLCASPTSEGSVVGDLTREWRTDEYEPALWSDKCNIPKEGPISPEEFEGKYVRPEKAVILTGITDNSRFIDMTRRPKLLESYGGHEVILSSANAFSYTKARSTLQEYILHMMAPQTLDTSADKTFYQFGDNYLPGWPEFLKNYVRPPYLDSETKGSLSFGMGGSGSGVPYHRHGPVFAEVLHGHKRWYLLPASHPRPHYHPNETSLKWTLEIYPTLPVSELPQECVCGPGEVIYIPDQWWHGTLNIGESVFISTFV
eukprot:comp22839_c1_seq1/m.35955 comp22839_c1_seq1/g.35955  ORF comp22839_c1_seq1/g.35955 comp22839_c1_seq1/m.35955 type:complete len:298 (-) comp22839_c1_seq1:611-1504(-)